MSLVGHLDELRTRIIISLAALVLCVVGAFFIAKPALNMLTLPVHALKQEPGRDRELTLTVQPDGALRLDKPEEVRGALEQLSQKRLRLVWPADPARNLPETSFLIGERPTQKFYYSSPIDPFMMQLKVSIILGILLALPILLWQVWGFISPGLTAKERRVVRPMLSAAIILFPLGAAFAYYLIRFVLLIMQIYAVENVDPLLNIFNYLSLLTTMMLIFGVIFEIPLLIAVAARVGLVSPQFLSTYRRHAYVVLSIAAMVITPGGDPLTMAVALVPLVLLYELSVALAYPMARLHQADQHAEEEEPVEVDEVSRV